MTESVKYEEYRDIIDEIQRIDNDTDNIFKILHQESYENKHSTFLSWLFNPKASHGLDSKFAEEFFKRVKIKNTEGDGFIGEGYNDIDAKRIRKVRTEVPIKGKKQKAEGKDRKRIDLLLEGEDFTCTIENKYGSKTHGGQCPDYKEFIQEHDKYKNYGSKNKFVFLDIEKPKDFDDVKQYANYDFISYREITEILDSMKTQKVTRQSDYIQQYKEVLNEKYNDNNNNNYITLCEDNRARLTYKVITAICSISNNDYDSLEYDIKRFVDVIRDYYDYRKSETDKEIKNNLQDICLDPFFFKDDYDKSSKKEADNSSDEISYAYAIPASIDVFNKAKYKKDWENQLKKNPVVKSIKKEMDKIVKNHTNENITFNTVDFRAPDMEYEGKSILLLAGYKPSLSRNIRDKLNDGSIDLEKLNSLSNWKTDCCYYLKSGAKTGKPLMEIPLIKDGFYKNAKIIFNTVFGKRKNLAINAEDIFSDDFWESLNTLDNYVSNKNSIQSFFVKHLISENSDSIKASKAFIAKAKELPALQEKWSESPQSQNMPYYMDYSKVTNLYSDNKQKRTIEQGIKDNYEIIEFKVWLQGVLENDDGTIKTELLGFVKEDMKKDTDGKIVSLLKNQLDDKKDKKAKKYLNNILKTDKKNTDKNHALDIDAITDNTIKDSIETSLDTNIKKIISDLSDQRRYKEFTPGISIHSLYKIKEDADKRNLKEIFYEETLKITNVYGLGEWFQNTIFKATEEWKN